MEENPVNNCIFCKIASGAIPSEVVYKDDHIVAFKDVNPQAPVHILVVPKEHDLESLNDASGRDAALLGHILYSAAKIANQMGLSEKGFRVVINTGPEAGQSIPHLHAHLLGGRDLSWPPG